MPSSSTPTETDGVDATGGVSSVRAGSSSGIPSQDAAGSERPRAATPNESRRVASVSVSVSRESRAEKEGFLSLRFLSSSGFTSSSSSPPSASRASMDPEGGRFVIPRCTFVRAAVAGDAGVSAPRRLRPERSRKARTSARCASRAAPTASSSNRMRPTAPRRSEASSIDVSETDFSIFPPVSSTPGSAGLNASSGTSTDAPARTKLKLRSPPSRGGVSSADSSSSHDGKPRNAASGSDASSSESSVSTRSPGMGRFSSKRAAASAAMRAAVAEGVSSASRQPSADRVPNAPGI